MEEVGRTFPEAPEWSTNWGELDGLVPPYIRLSGMKDKASDWTGFLNFDALPVSIQGGSMSLKLRSTQKAKAGVWLVGDFGSSQIFFQNLEANRTTTLGISVGNLIGNSTAKVVKVGVGLFDVPAYQYTTLFVDDVAFSCGTRGNIAGGDNDAEEVAFEYVYSDLIPSTVNRENKFAQGLLFETSAAYTAEQRSKLVDSTNMQIVVSEQEHNQIVDFLSSATMTPQKSRQGWFRNMYFLDRNRLRDSVIANPKSLFYEAEVFAANADNREMPLLVGNVDYGYRVCADTSCSSKKILQSRLLQIGLPSARVHGSKLRLYYDPYFVSTNRGTMPVIEIYGNGKWNVLSPKSDLELAFESAGVQKIQVKVSEGGKTVNHNLFVEVE